MKLATKLIHSIPVEQLTGALSIPIYQTSSFVQEAPGINRGFYNSRNSNPTRSALENLIAAIEEGEAGFAFSSGMAAVDMIVRMLEKGDELIVNEDINSSTLSLFKYIQHKLGLHIIYTDTSNIDKLIKLITDQTKMIWLEMPTSATLKISDIRTISKIAHQHHSLLIVDNTIFTPALQKPLTQGADIVIHRASRFLAGHSNVIAGLVVVKDKKLAEEVKIRQTMAGNILGPFDSWLTILGIETLDLRMEKQSSNAMKLAKWLDEQTAVAQVYYPGLLHHNNHHLLKKHQKRYGAIISFYLKENTVKDALKIINGMKLFKLAESMGGVKSLLCHPATMTHQSLPANERRKAGIKDSLIMLSAGIEDEDDLTEDLQQAFDKLQDKVSTNMTIR